MQFEVFNCAMIDIYTKTRGEEVRKSNIHMLKQCYADMKSKQHNEICRFLDILMAIPTSEAICESWGSVIDVMSKDRQRASDGSFENEQYGTIENRIMVRLNGPPPGYKNNKNLLIHSLQDQYGMNYSKSFYTQSTSFALISKVQEKLIDGSHDEARNMASSRILPCFKATFSH